MVWLRNLPSSRMSQLSAEKRASRFSARRRSVAPFTFALRASVSDAAFEFRRGSGASLRRAPRRRRRLSSLPAGAPPEGRHQGSSVQIAISISLLESSASQLRWGRAEGMQQGAVTDLRCRDGDLALVVYDTPPCASNVWRAIVVSEPVRMDPDQGPTWLIHPVAPSAWAVERGWTRRVEFHAPPLDGVEHPDLWLMPLRPGEPRDQCVEATDYPVVAR